MVICQMAVTHALTMRSFGNLNRSSSIQQQDSNTLTIARLTKAFASQMDALGKLRRGGEQRLLSSTSISTRARRPLLERSLIPGDPGPSSKTKDNPMQRPQSPLSLQMAKSCRAKTRSGKPCQSPVVKGRKRCRMHGGAHGSGAPSGERNGNYRHGLYTAEAIAERKAVRAWLRSMRTQIE
jgi:hypothetical protein